jgi:hypothetical protein
MLPETLTPGRRARALLEAEFERFRHGMPADLRGHCLDLYGIDLSASYAGTPIPHPFGKASGQLSLSAGQVRRDADGGLAFVVLKTVIAQDEQGAQGMAAWAIPETRMHVERIVGKQGTPGWTVTWKGRGWHESFDAYGRFFGEALEAAPALPIVPSAKYHLPGAGETDYRDAEYRHTTRALQAVWAGRRPGPMPLEFDFSPTLAGDDRSAECERVLGWLRAVPGLVRAAAVPPGVTLGVKVMNARFDLEFQVEMVRALADEAGGAPEFLVYANRLFDPEREVGGVRGAAFGGPDLSRRNLDALERIERAAAAGRIRGPVPPISGTGDILTGRMAAEYGLRGASSCQMHTVFQLPDTEFAAATRNKTAAVLHHLLFHPNTGLLACLLHLREVVGAPVHWRDLPCLGRTRLR